VKTWVAEAGQRSVSFDDSGENSSHGLNAQRQRGHIDQDDILDISLQNTSLDGGSHGNCLVRVDSFVWLSSEEISTRVCTFGILVIPPTKRTSSICDLFSPASFRQFRKA
jgi:hypothetical protein